MKCFYKVLILLLLVFIISACSNGSSSNESNGDNTISETAYVTFRYDKDSSSYIGKAFWKATTTTQKVLCDPVYLQNVKWYSNDANGSEIWHILGKNTVDSSAGTITSNVRIYTYDQKLSIVSSGKETNGRDTRNICDDWTGCIDKDLEKYKNRTVIVTLTFIAPYDTPITIGQQTGFNSQND